jgi:uncharacterized membrane protein
LKLKYNLDLALAVLFSLLLIPAVALTDSQATRLVLGVPFLLFIPGYALVAALFPGRTPQGAIERITYSVALSIAMVMLDGLLLNYVWDIDVFPLLITLESLTFVALIIAWLRRRGLTDEDRMVFGANGPPKTLASADKLLVALLVLAVLGASGAAVYTGIKNTHPYSELYILGAGGKAEDYPLNLAVGQQGSLTLALTNHEKQTISYIIKISQDDGRTFLDGHEQTAMYLMLPNGGEQRYALTFTFDAPGPGKKLEFDLYRGDSAEIYVKTYLRVYVS